MAATKTKRLKKDYGEIEDVTVLRSLSVVNTGSARREEILGLRTSSQEDLELLIEKTRSALAMAVDFLVSDCKAISSDGKLDRYGGAPDKGFFVRSVFRKGAAASQAFAALLGYHGPRNITNGQAIDVGTALSIYNRIYNRKEFHHIFPQKVLKNWGTDSDLIGALANICMLASSENKKIGATPPSIYARKLQEKHGEDFEAVMESNLIPPEAIERLLVDDFSGFLEVRSLYLSNVISNLV